MIIFIIIYFLAVFKFNLPEYDGPIIDPSPDFFEDKLRSDFENSKGNLMRWPKSYTYNKIVRRYIKINSVLTDLECYYLTVDLNDSSLYLPEMYYFKRGKLQTFSILEKRTVLALHLSFPQRFSLIIRLSKKLKDCSSGYKNILKLYEIDPLKEYALLWNERGETYFIYYHINNAAFCFKADNQIQYEKTYFYLLKEKVKNNKNDEQSKSVRTNKTN